jgi:hypothetical protein
MANVQQELKRASDLLAKLIKDELSRQKLIDSGNLIKSIKPRYTITSQGYKLSIEALDYFKYLDARYNIMKNVLSSAAFKEVNQLLVDAAVKQFTEDILAP